MNESNNIEYVAMGAKPDPFNFSIVRFEVVGGGTIVLANYKGCLTYNGNKLLLLKGRHDPTTFKSLDPHFLEGHPVVARFSPTEEGWELAKVSAHKLPPIPDEGLQAIGTYKFTKNESGEITGYEFKSVEERHKELRKQNFGEPEEDEQ